MKAIPISRLKVNAPAEHDYYSSRGELLIAKGSEITDMHLSLLSRRNVFDVYIRLSEKDQMIQDLMSRKPDKLADLDFNFSQTSLPDIPPMPDFLPGKEGFDALLREAESAMELDKKLRAEWAGDRPIGKALRESAHQISADERTPEYKQEIALSYQNALAKTADLLTRLAKGERVDGGELRELVRQFVKVFVTDRNILLNISTVKPRGENHLFHHSLNVCLLAINIAAASGYNENQVTEIGMSSLVHDLGMLLIPSQVVGKKGRLTKEEWFEIQKHPILGLNKLERMKHLPEAALYVAYQTHERENQTGYPKQRSGRLIHRYAKIVQVADIYEALSSPRRHREAVVPYQCVERLVKMTNQNLISGDYVRAFLRYASLFPVGSIVELSDRRIGKVIQANGDQFSRPVISVLADRKGQLLGSNELHLEDLSRNKELSIRRALRANTLKDVGLMDGF